jgi:ATP-dependent DNA ligase
MLLSEIPGHRSDILAQEYVYIQPKINGWRTMLNTRTGKFYSRSGREITTMDHILELVPQDAPEWLDGELYAHGYSLDEIQSMIKQGDPRIQFHVFDVVWGLPYSLRYEAVRHLSERMHTVEAVLIRPSYIMPYFRDYLDQGYEGAVIRLDGHPYVHGRSTSIFKLKPGMEGI